MNTRTRITLSTVLGLSLVGVCLGSAQAQTETKKTKAEKREMKREMRHEAMDEMNESMWEEEKEPTPINYPFAAPGGVHLYHYTDFSHEAIGEGSAEMKRMDNRWHREKMMHERMMQEEAMIPEDEKKLMRDPAPIGYPFSAPGGLHLYHWTDYTHEALGPESAEMKRMDLRHEREMKVHDRMMHEDAMMSDDDKKMMREPTPIGYPFAAPGGLHLYHYTDFSQEAVGEGSAPMKKMDNMEKREKKMKERESK